MSRGVVFHSTALLVSGVFLLAVAAARLLRPLLRRRLGPGAADRAAVRRRCCSACWSRRPAASLEAQGLRQQALLLLSLRLSRGMAALHPHAVGAKASAQSVQERTIKALADWSKARRAASGSATDDAELRAGGALEHAGRSTRSNRADGSARAFLSGPAGSSISTSMPRSTRALSASSTLPDWLAAMPSAWLVVPLMSRHASCSVSSCCRRRGRRSTSTGRSTIC